MNFVIAKFIDMFQDYIVKKIRDFTEDFRRSTVQKIQNNPLSRSDRSNRSNTDFSYGRVSARLERVTKPRNDPKIVYV